MCMYCCHKKDVISEFKRELDARQAITSRDGKDSLEELTEPLRVLLTNNKDEEFNV